MNAMIDNAGFEDLVRARAYTHWENEGRPIGRDAEHWRLSEDEMRREMAPAAMAKAAKPNAAPNKAAAPRKKARG